MPRNVGASSHPVLRRWIFRQSWVTTTRATVMDSRTASGAATLIGMPNASSGTAMSASPKPNVERISVATNTTSRTYKVIGAIILPVNRSSGQSSYRLIRGIAKANRIVNRRLDFFFQHEFQYFLWYRGIPHGSKRLTVQRRRPVLAEGREMAWRAVALM